jgi:hypothetical protein
MIVGVDEVGTMQQKVDGWAYVLFSASVLSDFEKEACGLLNASHLDTFHAKNFTRRYDREYLHFLKLIKEYSMQSPSSLICVTLNSNVEEDSWKKEFEGFCNNLVEKIYEGIGIDSQEVKDTAKEFIGSLFQFQEVADKYQFPIDSTVKLIIDSDKKKRRLSESIAAMKVQSDLKYIFPQIMIGASHVLNLFYGKYRDRQFPHSPRLITNGIKVLWDEESYLIQAADVIGNFTLSYIFKYLGKQSKSNDLKASLYEEVFSDQINSIDFSNDLEIDGNDLIKKTEGLTKIAFSTMDLIRPR